MDGSDRKSMVKKILGGGDNKQGTRELRRSVRIGKRRRKDN